MIMPYGKTALHPAKPSSLSEVLMKRFAAAAGLAIALLSASPAISADFSPEQTKKMSVFLSNFTELGYLDFDRADILNENDPADMIRFGIWHNYVNNYKSRIAPCRTKECGWGSLTIKGAHVRESVKKYFDYDIRKLVTVEQSDPPYHLEGDVYHFEGADGELTHFARVEKAVKRNDGTVFMEGVLYNAEDAKEKLGTFKAVARPHTWNGKPTWAIMSLHSELSE